MVMASGESTPMGQSASISLLGWCDLGTEILLVMERPEVCMSLVEYLNKAETNEATAKVRTLPVPLLGQWAVFQLQIFETLFFLSGADEATGRCCH